jgi:hypothetical protein
VALALLVALSFAFALFAPISLSASPRPAYDEGSDHVYCCETWRGCWAWSEEGWVKHRYGDCLDSTSQPGSFSLWRCRCPRRPLGHLPNDTKHQPSNPRSGQKKL